MSLESLAYLHDNVLAGFADKHGSAWWSNRGWAETTDSFGEPNHYPGAIPLDDVLRRLPAFANEAISVQLQARYPNPLFGKGDDEEPEFITVTDPERQVILRPDTGTIFGVFKKGYRMHQYKDKLIDWTSQILDTSVSELGIANVVVLRNGAVAVVQFEVPDNITTKEGVEFRASLYVATSLNGSLATTHGRCIENIVCDNTMAAGMDESKDNGTLVKTKHSLYSEQKLDAMRAKLEIEFTVDAFTEELTRLCSTEVSGKAFVEFLKAERLIDGKDPLAADAEDSRARTMADKKQDILMNLYLNDNRVSPWGGTAFGVLQMMNTYTQQIAPTNKGTIRLERNWFDLASGKTEKSDLETLKTLDMVLASV